MTNAASNGGNAVDTFLSQLFARLKGATLVCDSQWHIIAITPEAEVLCEHVNGTRSLFTKFPFLSETRPAIEQAAKEHKPLGAQRIYWTRGDNQNEAQIEIFPLPLTTTAYYLVQFNALTTQETQNRMLNNERLINLGILTAGITHELKNPIGFVAAAIDPVKRNFNEIVKIINMTKAYASEEKYKDLLKEIWVCMNNVEIDVLIKETQDLLAGIEEGSSRTFDIVKGVKTLSQVQHELKDMLINEGIDATLMLLRHHLKFGIILHKEYARLPTVRCHPSQISQVILNLLMNAVDALPQQKGNIWIKTTCEGDDVLIRIKDDGCGIAPELQNRVFEPFFTTKDFNQGSGLGLHISKSIIDKHGGSITFTSQPGLGTEFIVRLAINSKRC